MNDKQSQNRFLAFGGETVFKLNPASYTQEKMWGRYMESLRKNLSAYTLDDAPEDVRELYKDEFIQLYASSIRCFLICIKLGFISGRSSFAPRLNQIWRQVRSGESYNRAESSYTSSSSLYCRILCFVRK